MNRMNKILFLSQFLPYHPNTGGKKKTWAILNTLAKKSKIHLVCFIDDKKDLSGLKRVKKICHQVDVFENPIITQTHRRLRRKAIASLFSLKPFRVLKHYSTPMALRLREILQQESFDIIYFDHDVMLQYLDLVQQYSNARIIFDEHNITSEGAWQNFLIEENFLSKFGYLLELIKWLFFERYYYPKCDLIFSISPNDRAKIIRMHISPAKVVFLPIPIRRYHLKRIPHQVSTILFIGLMSWKPNSDGFWWFVRNIYPLVQKTIPNLHFIVIGPHPSPEMINYSKNHNVEIKGFIKDLNPYYQQAGVFIAPIRSGSGIRIKLLEALARGLPCVSTSAGAYGLPLVHRRELFISDTPTEFADHVIRILENRSLRLRLSRRAQSFIQKNYNSKATLKVFHDFNVLT